MNFTIGQKLKNEDVLNIRYISHLYDYCGYYVWKKYIRDQNLTLLEIIWNQYIHDIEFELQSPFPEEPLIVLDYHDQKYIDNFEIALIVNNTMLITNPYGTIKNIYNHFDVFCYNRLLNLNGYADSIDINSLFYSH